jgi:hypothetical protein
MIRASQFWSQKLTRDKSADLCGPSIVSLPSDQSKAHSVGAVTISYFAPRTSSFSGDESEVQSRHADTGSTSHIKLRPSDLPMPLSSTVEAISSFYPCYPLDPRSNSFVSFAILPVPTSRHSRSVHGRSRPFSYFFAIFPVFSCFFRFSTPPPWRFLFLENLIVTFVELNH